MAGFWQLLIGSVWVGILNIGGGQPAFFDMWLDEQDESLDVYTSKLLIEGPLDSVYIHL